MMTNLTTVCAWEIPETINIHLTRRCDLGCKFCYAQFAECNSGQIPPTTLRQILETIGEAPPGPSGRRRKVNFAGGEPLLYAELPSIVEFSKGLGLVTSMVTNGSLLHESTLSRLAGALDICAISLDSGSPGTNIAIGRYGKNFQPDAQFYFSLGRQIKAAGIRLKINTVVNRHNISEKLGELVSELRPFRWKLFQVKRVIGQNNEHFEELAISVAEFEDFVTRNRRWVAQGIAMVPESSEDMSGSYAMVAPNGCFFDSADGFHRYSRPILEVGITDAFRDVEFDADKFVNRGGLYE